MGFVAVVDDEALSVGKFILAAGAAIMAVIVSLTLFIVFIGAAAGGVASNSDGDVQADLAACLGPVGNPGLKAGKVPAEYEKDIKDAAASSGMPAAILAGQIQQESGWNPQAVSPVGAQGIAQFMPGTWTSYGQGKDPFDGHAGIAAQGRFMGELLKQAKASGFKNDPVDLALAGYNAGWGGVMNAGGIPDNGETAQYVTSIRTLAKAYEPANGGGVAEPVTETTGCGSGGGGSTTGTDDYPGKNLPHCLLDAAGAYAGCPDGSVSVFGAYNGECVDFVMWRLNQQLGSSKPPYKVTNSSFRGDGAVLGNAVTYLDAWKVKGWSYGHTPVVGAVVYFNGSSPFAATGGYGHVAIVKEVLPDGSYMEEGYNFGLPPGDHKYYTMKRKNADPTFFLYLPGKGASA